MALRLSCSVMYRPVQADFSIAGKGVLAVGRCFGALGPFPSGRVTGNISSQRDGFQVQFKGRGLVLGGSAGLSK